MRAPTDTCPLMVRARMVPTTCDFPEICTVAVCFWAKFHEIDPHTLKPVARVGSCQHGEAQHQDP